MGHMNKIMELTLSMPRRNAIPNPTRLINFTIMHPGQIDYQMPRKTLCTTWWDEALCIVTRLIQPRDMVTSLRISPFALLPRPNPEQDRTRFFLRRTFLDCHEKKMNIYPRNHKMRIHSSLMSFLDVTQPRQKKEIFT